jgi:3'-5' exoribonuclease
VAKTFISDIQANQDIATSFVVTEKQLRTARNGTPFLTLKLADKTGEIVGRVWERAEETAALINAKGAVFVRGRSEVYRDEMQLQVQEISALPLDKVDPADFLPVCPISAETLFERLKGLAASIKKRPLTRLMKHFLADGELMARFRLAPAAKSVHHAYLGGLIEHTVSVMELGAAICGRYPDLDSDLLLVGAFLHDVGKIDEFVYDLAIDYSHEGRLLGHIVLGTLILEDKVRGLKNFPAEEALLLKHMILSHHGEADHGVVRLPMTREAVALHFADDLDAKMNSLTRILSGHKDGDPAWTSYQPLYERFFFRGLPDSREAIGASEVHWEQEKEQEQERGVQLSIWTGEKKKKGGG